MLDTVLADQRRMSNIIADRTGLSAETCMELFKAQKTRDASWAKTNAVVQEVRDFRYPPPGAQVHLFAR